MTKNILALVLMMLLSPLISPVVAQLSGSYSIPANFASLAAAVASLNAGGVTGPVTITIPSGYTETAPAGGYTLTATGTPANPIVFQKGGAGANPLLIAYAGGVATPTSAKQDGVWSLLGCDYITIDGIDIVDQNPAIIPSLMEYGIGLFKAGATNGCQNNVVKNCVITLNRNNFAMGGVTGVNGSRGINMMNALYTSQTTLLGASSPAGSNSNNRFYSNTIQNCNTGIVLNGSQSPSPYANADSNNDVGGTSAATGNTVINYGGGGASEASAIQTLAQYNVKISYNRVNNNTGAGTDAGYTLKGIFTDQAQGANVTVTNNTLTLHCLDVRVVIYNQAGNSGTTNTINISNNLITGCTNINYTGILANYDILNSGSPSVLSITGNTITNGTSNSSNGFNRMICNFSNTIARRIDISNNSLDFSYANSPNNFNESIFPILSNGGTSACTVTINDNKFSNFSFAGSPGTGYLTFISNYGTIATCTISGNTWHNLLLNHQGDQCLIQNSAFVEGPVSVTNNSIVGSYTRTGPINGHFYGYTSDSYHGYNCTEDISGNNFSNITGVTTGTASFYGIRVLDDGYVIPRKNIHNNIISAINYQCSGEIVAMGISNMGDGATTSGSAIYNNTISNIASSGYVFGLAVSGTVSTGHDAAVYSNTIHTLSSGGSTVLVAGLYSDAGANGLNLYKNKIYDVAANGTWAQAYGMYIQRAANTTAYNNMIGEIKAPASNDTNAVAGIFIDFMAARVNLYNNTVYLDGGSSGTHFGSAALYAYTGATLTLRNNIFINLATPNGAGLSAAYKRRSPSLGTYAAGSNNNVFYAGIPGPKHVLFTDGTNSYPVLAGMQAALAPREASSITEHTPFLSTVGTNINYLHVDPTLPSNTSNGATALPMVTDDIDGQARHGAPGYTGTGTAPDIGADEYDQVAGPCAAVAAGIIAPITYSSCAGTAFSIAAGGFTSTANTGFQWLVSPSTGGPYSPVSAGGSQLSFTNASPAPGIYYYLLQASCTAASYTTVSNEAAVTVYALPAATVGAAQAMLCVGETLQLNASPAGTNTFAWNGPGGYTAQGPSVTISNAPLSASGIYTLLVSDNHCTAAPLVQQVLVDACTGLRMQVESSAYISVYPNPSNGMVTAGFNFEGVKTIRITNAQGATVYESTSSGTSETFDLAGYAKGIYFITLRCGGTSVSCKIINE